jgi:hypothetical protein
MSGRNCQPGSQKGPTAQPVSAASADNRQRGNAESIDSIRFGAGYLFAHCGNGDRWGEPARASAGLREICDAWDSPDAESTRPAIGIPTGQRTSYREVPPCVFT